MKTTQERRDRFREWLHDDTRDHLSIRAWCVAEDACDDVDTLLAENAKLLAVAEAARAVRWEFGDDYKGRFSPLDAALEALEAP
ncbi:MAG: hypothetical protein IPF92_21635 [Myxococcales bacterium]|nr:hypothetical protein [Myxococcales bacterium]